MADIAVTVEEILSANDKDQQKFKSIEVFKEVEPSFDLGNLFMFDNQPVSVKEFKHNKEKFLLDLARDNAQLLFSKIWELPIEKVDNIICAKLPAQLLPIPREKPCPIPKPPTKWEEYAQKKGITNKKRSRMLWDEESKTYKPRHGYKRGEEDVKQWCIEVPTNADQYEDQFDKVDNVKKEKVAKNELQRLRNIAKNTKGGKKAMIMSTQLKPTAKKDKERVATEMDVAQVSTASGGKFQPRLHKEKVSKKTGIKRKFESVSGDLSHEKSKAMAIFEKLSKPKSLDVTKAVNKHVADEQRETHKNKGSGKVKNQHYKKGKHVAMEKKRAKGKTLGKGRATKSN
jgi:regulator of ribosome biosynthesis